MPQQDMPATPESPIEIPALSFASIFPTPTWESQFRLKPEDFCVDETLGFEPSGEGEHIFLHLQKTGENTAWLAEKIAAYAGVRVMDVGYCGRKDRHAVTQQWFSVYKPGKAAEDVEGQPLDWQQWIDQTPELHQIRLLSVTRHHRKLKLGQHQANRFVIRLRDLLTEEESGLAEENGTVRQEVERRLNLIKAQGVPNYFGIQRFGREGSNLFWAERWLGRGETIRHRQKRSMALSAARAYLFNSVLSARVEQNTWQTSLEGDVLEDNLPTAPLWGRGRSATEHEALDVERSALQPWQQWQHSMEHCGLKQERRPLVMTAQDLGWQFQQQDLILSFTLAPGQFATSLLAELSLLQNVAPTQPGKNES